jgi:Flp pilus assembly protein CpaB
MGDIGLVPMTYEQMRERQLPLELTMLASDQIIGRRLMKPLKQGEPFLTTDFYPQGTGPIEPSVYEKLQPGYRAVTLPLPIEDTASVTEGALVDVLFRATPSGRIPEMLVTLVEGAEVLKIDKPAERYVRPPSSGGGVYYVQPPPYTATLGVRYEDARKLEVVQGKGDISLVARSPGDVSPSRFDPLTLAQVLQIADPLPPIRETPFETEIFIGGRRVTNSFSPSLLPQNEPPAREYVPDIFDRSGLPPSDKPPTPSGRGPGSENLKSPDNGNEPSTLPEPDDTGKGNTPERGPTVGDPQRPLIPPN